MVPSMQEQLREAEASEPLPSRNLTEPAARAATLLRSWALVVAVGTGLLVAVLLLSYQRDNVPLSKLTITGIVAAQAPVVLSLLPLVLPKPARTPAAFGGAVIVLAAALLLPVLSTDMTDALFYIPLAAFMWAVVIVPWLVARGLNLATAAGWRLIGAVGIAVPGGFAALLLYFGMAEMNVGIWAWMLCPLLLAVTFALGVRPISLVIAVLGAATMIVAFWGGLLILAIWWIGGLWLVIGISAFAAWKPHHRRAHGKK